MLNNSGLWAAHTLAILNPMIVKAVIERSKEAPVTIQLTRQALAAKDEQHALTYIRLSPLVRAAITHAFDEAWRAKSVYLSGTASLLQDLLRRLSNCLRHQTPSVLESFTLETRRTPSPTGSDPRPLFSSAALFGGQNPELKQLSLRGLAPSWPYPLYGSNIKRLSLRFILPLPAHCLPPSYDDLFAWLGTLPLLEHLDLENAFPADTLAPSAQYTLPNLQEIILWARPSEVIDPFRSLLLPSSNRMRVIWRNIYTRTDDVEIEAQHFSMLSSPSLPNYDVAMGGVSQLIFKAIRFLKVTIDVNGPITIDGYSSLMHWPLLSTSSTGANVCTSQTHFRLETIHHPLFVDAIYSLMILIRILHVSSVETLFLSVPTLTHRARTHYLQDARPFTAVHTVVLENSAALVLFLDMHVSVWKSGVPDPDCDAYNVIFPLLRQIILLEVDAEPELKARFLGYLKDCQERGKQLEELHDEGIRDRVMDSEWLAALQTVVHKVDWK